MKILIKILLSLSVFMLSSSMVISEGAKITQQQAEKIILLKQEMQRGKFTNYLNDSYGEFISEAAMKLLSEEQLIVIADNINLGAKLFPDRISELIEKSLWSAYRELDLGSKYQLLGLFINESGSDTSYYFNDPEIQFKAMEQYVIFLYDDNISPDDIMDDYVQYTPLLETHPFLTDEIKKLTSSQ